jgi:FPC/CPF motif-containing protein YcgG
VRISVYEGKETLSNHCPCRTRKQILEQFSRDSWQLQAYEAFAEKLGDRKRIFPCIYATKGLRADELAFVFLEYQDPTTPEAIEKYAKAILAYDYKSHDYGDNTSLVVLYPDTAEQHTVEEYHSQFWAFLKGLKRLDPKPWPGHINENTDSPFWAMCFDGKMSFWAVLTPAHSRRRSRYLPNLAIIYQPRWIFEELLSTDAKRTAALETVRGLIDKYDDPLPKSPDLGNFGQLGKSESYQYFSMDENITQPCPYEKL